MGGLGWKYRSGDKSPGKATAPQWTPLSLRRAGVMQLWPSVGVQWALLAVLVLRPTGMAPFTHTANIAYSCAGYDVFLCIAH